MAPEPISVKLLSLFRNGWRFRHVARSRRSTQPVDDPASGDHTDPTDERDHAGLYRRLVRTKIVGPREKTGHPGAHHAQDEHLQAAAEIGEDRGACGEQPPEKVTHTLPGHILFIDSPPVKLEKPRKPLVDGLDQYEVTIIDTSQEAKSKDDTRFVSDAALRDENEAKGKQRGSVASPNYKGVGRGHIRFYADGTGDIKGIAFSFDKAKFHGLDDWNIVVGRPKLITN